MRKYRAAIILLHVVIFSSLQRVEVFASSPAGEGQGAEAEESCSETSFEESSLLQQRKQVKSLQAQTQPLPAKPTTHDSRSSGLEQAKADSSVTHADSRLTGQLQTEASLHKGVTKTWALLSIPFFAAPPTVQSTESGAESGKAKAKAKPLSHMAASLWQGLELPKIKFRNSMVALGAHEGSPGLWSSLALGTLLLGAAVFYTGLPPSDPEASAKADLMLVEGNADSSRWWLIVTGAVVQMMSGSVYAMGAWQDDLRDALGVSMTGISIIIATTFAGSIFAGLGGFIFDRLGPRAAVTLGGTLCTVGYLFIGLAVVAGDTMPAASKLTLAALGSLMAGYSSVSLLDNVVCMACSLSFPNDRAAVVGYLKAVLATAAGLWALLWVHVFKAPHGPGLPAFLLFSAVVTMLSCTFALTGLRVLPEHSQYRRVFNAIDMRRFWMVIVSITVLSLFDVGVSFLFSTGKLEPTTKLGYVGSGLSLLPLLVLMTCNSDTDENKAEVEKVEANSGAATDMSAATSAGLTFWEAVFGLDFWLLWFLQFAVFGAGVATNQNLALILESAGSPSASGLGVALFALASSLSRIGVGILSDKYNQAFSRFNWLTVIAISAVAGNLLCSLMSFATIMFGALVMGFAFGAFFTVIVPIVNEMYGRKQFGVILGSQLASQAAAAFIICLELIPMVYKRAANGQSVCKGSACFQASFFILAGVSVFGFLCCLLLQFRNRSDMPVDRLSVPPPPTPEVPRPSRQQ